MDLDPTLAVIREGIRPHWKRELKVAERNNMNVISGSDETLFEEFIGIYKEMVSRKHFIEPNDINQFKVIQNRLPHRLKMNIMICKSGNDICAGSIYSTIGKTAIYLFGATSNAGMKSRGSYLLQWKFIEMLKQNGIKLYNLNGINPVENPGTYKFKCDLSGAYGKSVYFLGRFESKSNALSHWMVRCGEMSRTGYRRLRNYAMRITN
jgi:peptidoglycan pentaglycine glycine transferase (the first glycine)